MFDVRNYSAIKNFMMIANKLLVSKMKDEADGVTVEKFVWWNPNMYLFLEDYSNEHEKAKCENKNVVATKTLANTKMFCCIINVFSIQWIESKVKIIKLEPIISTKFHYHVLMLKYCKQWVW